METTAPRVVVGVDATPASTNGVIYAALEAQRLGLALEIVHATPGYDDAQSYLSVVDGDTLAAYGHRLLTEAAEQAAAVAPSVGVRTHLVSGRTVATLVSCSERAAMLVLGAERRTFAGRVWTGDVVAGAAAQAQCPVVVVPPEWQPSEEHGRVVVGLKSTAEAGELLRAGLELAHACKAELVVVHAWKLASGYDDIVSDRVDAEAQGRHTSGLVEPLVNELRQSCPEVPVRIEVRHAQPAFALVDASTGADRLLLSRPKRAGVLHHLGGVARAVLREARCPVEILPPG